MTKSVKKIDLEEYLNACFGTAFKVLEAKGIKATPGKALRYLFPDISREDIFWNYFIGFRPAQFGPRAEGVPGARWPCPGVWHNSIEASKRALDGAPYS